MWKRAGRSPGALGAVSPPLGAAASAWGWGAAVSLVGLRPEMGRGGGERGGPSGPLTPPPNGRGEAAWRFRPRGASRRPGGAHSSPAPLQPVRAGHSCRRSPQGCLLPLLSSRGAGWLGAAVRVSAQRLVGCGAVGPPSRSLSPPSLPQEVARAPPSGCIVGGAWVGAPGSAGGGVPRHCPPSTLSRPSSGPSPASPLVWGLGL